MNSKYLFTLVVTLANISAPCWAQQPLGKIDLLTRSAHIIFLGRIVRLPAANVGVPTEGTAVVRVEELLDAPAGVSGIKGQDVTVELSRPEEWKAEQHVVFFTNGVLFGQHLAVKEVGNLPVPTDLTEMRAQIAGVRAKIGEEALQARIASSILVISGKVVSVKEIERIGGRSEHEGDWAVAGVQVESIEKGSFEGKTVSVYFPQSTDERWLLSPKFQVGQQGIWILHREGKFGLPEAALTALNPLDFQPLAEREKIRRLVR